MRDLVGTEDNPVPEGAVVSAVTSEDGVRLRVARWPRQGARARGTIVLLHGRAEFIEKYFETIEDLRRRGFAVVTFDWRGQGGSERLLRDPLKGHVGDFREYELDLEAVMDAVVLPDGTPPYYVLAHSTGGAVALRHAARRGARLRLERMVLTAPLLRLPDRPVSHETVTRLATTFTVLGMTSAYMPLGGGRRPVTALPFAGNPVTSDPRRYARAVATVRRRPELGLGGPTVGWVHAAAKAMAEIADPLFPPTIQVPVLMIAAGRDRIVSTPAVEALGREMRTGGHVLIPGALHELLMERDLYRSQFWAAFDAFIPETPVA